MRCRPAGRGRRSARAAAFRRRAPAPTRTSGRSAPAPVRRRAHRRPRQRRAAPGAAGGTGRRRAGRARAPRRPARCRWARGSRRTGGSSGAPPVPTSTTRSPGTSGSAPAPRSRSTSQRSAVHARGSRPERSRTCGARPSTAASPTNRPPTVLSRTSATAVGSPAGSADRACRALRSSELQALAPARGHAEPDGAHGACGGGNALDVLGDAAVLRDGRSGEDPREHGSGGRDAERRDERASVAAAEATEREADDVPGAPHYLRLRLAGPPAR